jgi:hypothetical protein
MCFAHNKIAAEKHAGRLAPARLFACVDCAKAASEYDHRNYLMPLEVQPVCRGCNKKRGPAKYRVAA